MISIPPAPSPPAASFAAAAQTLICMSGNAALWACLILNDVVLFNGSSASLKPVHGKMNQPGGDIEQRRSDHRSQAGRIRLRLLVNYLHRRG
jgi:hypothetical protein